MDLRVSDQNEKARLLEAIEKVLDHGRVLLGPEHDAFEQAAAQYCGRKFGIGVNSGTDALFLGLKALGIGSGDEVITSPLSWIATANAIRMTGADPVFADIGADLNIDPESVHQCVTAKTRAILPVHYRGKVCDMNALLDLAKEKNLAIIEDASQAFGARYHGRVACSFGDLACVSLNPMKVLASCGEAGIVLTDNQELKEKLVVLRYNGMIDREVCKYPSLNGRLDTIQAAILLERLKSFKNVIARRRRIAKLYNEKLRKLVTVPHEQPYEHDVYYTYTIQTSERDNLQEFLLSKGIEAKVRDRHLMPNQPAYMNGVKGTFPLAIKLVGQLLSLPAHEKLLDSDVCYIADVIKEFFKNQP
jgi:dTDP-4-amino-4,6-dideoxygalactose transaminase